MIAGMHKGHRVIVMAFLVFAVSAYTSAGAWAADTFEAGPPPPPGEALVYLFRAPSYWMSFSQAALDIDGVNVARLKNKTYTWLYVPAGAHDLKFHWPISIFYVPTASDLLTPNDGTVFMWKSGETYFYKFSTEKTFGYRSSNIITSVSSPRHDDALTELATYHHLPAINQDKIASPARATTGVPAAGTSPDQRPVSAP